MASATRLGPRDLDGALAVVAEAASTGGAQPFEPRVIDRLLDMIPADRGGYFEFRKPRFDIYKAELRPLDMDWRSDQIRALVRWWPLHDQHWDGTTEHAVRLSDCLTMRQRLRNPWYIEVMRGSTEHEMKLWLPAPDGIVRGFWVQRGPDSRDFDDRDRAVLTVLRPHLAAVRERWERRRRPAFLLTTESSGIDLVRGGLTNHEIAARLVISAGTVRSHLEHIFEKLDVHTRTAAVARAFGPET